MVIGPNATSSRPEFDPVLLIPAADSLQKLDSCNRAKWQLNARVHVIIAKPAFMLTFLDII